MGSTHSLATTDSVRSSQKRKYNARSTGGAGMQPPSSKWASKSKTDNLNPVVLSSALNLTLNHLADVMEKSLDTTAAITTTSSTTSSVAPPSIVMTPQTTQPLSTPPQLPMSNPVLSSREILDHAMKIITVDDGFVTEDELFAASMFFSTEDAILPAQTFITLGNNRAVQRRFLIQQLTKAGLLLNPSPEKESNHSMLY
jgi:hypothetical protein